MDAQPPQLDLTLLLPPDLACAIDTADRAVRGRIDGFSDNPDSPIFQNDVRALATLVRIRKTVADFLLRHSGLLPSGPAPENHPGSDASTDEPPPEFGPAGEASPGAQRTHPETPASESTGSPQPLQSESSAPASS